MTTNRRTFLKAFIGGIAVAALPVSLPEFFGDLPKANSAYELSRALSVGSLVQGSPLIVEDLTATLKLVTFDDSHIKLHRMLIEPSSLS